jgi:iron complex outermembrane receptor protein
VPTWRAEADYDLSGVSLVYASVNRGYKPGGVNGDNGQVVVPPTFEPETNTAFEVGAKNRFLGQALTLNLTAFYYLYKNMQYIEDDPRPFDSGIANIPDVHAYGAELEAAYVNPDGRLRLSGQVSFQRGRVVGPYATLDSTVVNRVENAGPPSPCASGGRFFNTACWDLVVAAATNIEGRSPPAMPSVSAQFTAAYRFDALGGALTPQVQFVWRGSEWARIFNEPSLDRVPGYGVVNLNLDYRPSGSALSVALTATNLFNIAGVNSQYTDPFGTGQTSRQYIAPRQVIVTLGYAF